MTQTSSEPLVNQLTLDWNSNFRVRKGRAWVRTWIALMGLGGLYATYWIAEHANLYAGNVPKVWVWTFVIFISVINIPAWLLAIYSAAFAKRRKVAQVSTSPSGVRVQGWHSSYLGAPYVNTDEHFDWSTVSIKAGVVNAGDVEQAGPGLIVEFNSPSAFGIRIELPAQSMDFTEQFVRRSSELKRQNA